MTLSDLYKNGSPLSGIYKNGIGIPLPNISSGPGTLSSMFSPAQRQLPNGGGSYVAPVTTPPQATMPVSTTTPVTPNGNPVNPAPRPTVASPAPASQQVPINPAFINPKTGGFYTPEELASNMRGGATTAPADGSAVSKYAGDAIVNPNQSVEELNRSGYGMNNAANDIATGATDPYKVGSKSGIAYSPSELSAIEKAYAGIYDPALSDVFSKLEAKKKEEELAANRKADLEKLAIEHQYRMAEKSGTGSGSSSTGGYVRGDNAIVDGWVDKINREGGDINKLIPGVANQGLRNQIMLGLNQTKFENAKTKGNLDSINTINTLLGNKELDNISGFLGQAVGGMWGDAKTAKTQFNQIAGLIQLAKAGSIQGQGAISEFERKILRESAAAIDRGQSDEDFRKALVKIRGAYMTSSGLEAPVKIIDPTTGQSEVQNLNTQEIDDFIGDGAIIEYVEQ